MGFGAGRILGAGRKEAHSREWGALRNRTPPPRGLGGPRLPLRPREVAPSPLLFCSPAAPRSAHVGSAQAALAAPRSPGAPHTHCFARALVGQNPPTVSSQQWRAAPCCPTVTAPCSTNLAAAPRLIVLPCSQHGFLPPAFSPRWHSPAWQLCCSLLLLPSLLLCCRITSVCCPHSAAGVLFFITIISGDLLPLCGSRALEPFSF